MKPYVRATAQLVLLLTATACRPFGLGHDPAPVSPTPTGLSYAGVWRGTTNPGDTPRIEVILRLHNGPPGSKIGSVSNVTGKNTICSGSVRLGSNYAGEATVSISIKITSDPAKSCYQAVEGRLTLMNPTQISMTTTGVTLNGRFSTLNRPDTATLTKVG